MKVEIFREEKTEKVGSDTGAEGSLFICVVFIENWTVRQESLDYVQAMKNLESLSRVFRFLFGWEHLKNFQLCFGKINPLLRMAWLLKMLMSKINKVVHLFSSMEEISLRASWEYVLWWVCGIQK